MGTFGYTGVDCTTNTDTNDKVVGCEYPFSVSGQVADSITAYLHSTASNVKTKAGIYKASDNSLVGATEEKTLSLGGTPQQVTFNFSPSPSLPAENNLLCIWADDEMYMRSKWTSGVSLRKDDEIYTGTFPDTFADDLEQDSRKACIYCTYSAAGPAGKGLINKLNRRTMLPHISALPRKIPDFNSRFPRFKPTIMI